MARCDIHTSGGFAYLWLLITIALMGLGAAMTVEIQQTLAQREREQELIFVGRQFRTALASYRQARPDSPPLPAVTEQPIASVTASSTFTGLATTANARQYPASLDDLLKDDRFPGIRRHLRKVFVDPMTGKPEWGMVKIGGRIVGIHSLSQDVPFKQDDFDTDEHTFSHTQSYAQWIFTPDPGILPPAKP